LDANEEMVKCSHCDKQALYYCIVLDDIVACDDHVVGDYFREMKEK
jgi:hypothetical protein